MFNLTSDFFNNFSHCAVNEYLNCKQTAWKCWFHWFYGIVLKDSVIFTLWLADLQKIELHLVSTNSHKKFSQCLRSFSGILTSTWNNATKNISINIWADKMLRFELSLCSQNVSFDIFASLFGTLSLTTDFSSVALIDAGPGFFKPFCFILVQIPRKMCILTKNA